MTSVLHTAACVLKSAAGGEEGEQTSSDDGNIAAAETSSMAGSRIATALAAATAALFITFYLLTTLGLPELDFLRWRYEAGGSGSGFRSLQAPLNPPSVAESPQDGPSQYMLGVGKADITGYSNIRSEWRDTADSTSSDLSSRSI